MSIKNISLNINSTSTREALQIQEDAARDLYLQLRAIGLEPERACVAAAQHDEFMSTLALHANRSLASLRELAIKSPVSFPARVFYARCAGVRLAAEQIGDIK
jgi:hypothetical protein